jgi:methylthioribulose-1-phosphate dehydratase
MLSPQQATRIHPPTSKRSRAAFKKRFPEIANSLCVIAQNFYSRGWAMGTGGNYSAVVDLKPLQLAITPSGMDKGMLAPSNILQVNHMGDVVHGKHSPSYELKVHLAIVRLRNAGAVFHTHSLWGTILSEKHALEHGFVLEGYEMLKGLAGVSTHQYREWVPILQNCQDMAQFAKTVSASLNVHPESHGFLVQGHGLYTWGCTVQEAKRHVEILEFLFEVIGHTQILNTNARR